MGANQLSKPIEVASELPLLQPGLEVVLVKGPVTMVLNGVGLIVGAALSDWGAIQEVGGADPGQGGNQVLSGGLCLDVALPVLRG